MSKNKPGGHITAEWRNLTKAKMRDYLLEHVNIPDTAYSKEKRQKGETRSDFIVRMYKEKKLLGKELLGSSSRKDEVVNNQAEKE